MIRESDAGPYAYIPDTLPMDLVERCARKSYEVAKYKHFNLRTGLIEDDPVWEELSDDTRFKERVKAAAVLIEAGYTSD